MSRGVKAALKITDLRKTYNGKEVVKGISFSVEPGEIFGLLGPNGAGKSTTINMITGVCHVGGGQAEIFGKNVVSDYIETRRFTGVMHQEVVLDLFFNIEQALKLHEGYYGVRPDPKWRNRLVEALALGPFLKMRTNQLSGGTKRRFMVAKALVHKPRLLILDEPTAGVDVELRHNLWTFVREMNAQGTTVLLTTHYLEEAEAMCGRIGIMNEGKLVALEHQKKLLELVAGKRIVVTLAAPLAKIPQDLAEFSPQISEDKLKLELAIAPTTSVEKLLSALLAQKINFVDVESRAAKLEDVFLKLTRRSTGNVHA